MTKTFEEVISGIRKAKKGVEVREDLAQMGEYCKQFTDEAGQKADSARDEAKGYADAAKASEKKATDAVAGIEQTKTDAVQAVQNAQNTATTAVTTKQTEAVQAVDDERDAALQQVADSTQAAQTAASNAAASEQAAQASKEAAATSAEGAASSATAASGSASAAATSESNAASSAQSANTYADRAEAAANLAGTRANTDKTLKTENAPADAAAVGDIILDRTKETPQPIFYSKAEVDALLTKHTKDALLAACPVGRLYMSAEATSPASFIGGTWERIEGRFIMGASDTYPAGSTGGSATHTQAESEVGSHVHPSIYAAGYHQVLYGATGGLNLVANSMQVTYNTGNNEDNREKLIAEKNEAPSPMDILNPYYAAYIWRRIA